jgi:hypothetical protein
MLLKLGHFDKSIEVFSFSFYPKIMDEVVTAGNFFRTPISDIKS